MKHYETCTADYPEKPDGEQPQRLERIDLGNGEYVMQCVDCGAFDDAAETDERVLCTCRSCGMSVVVGAALDEDCDNCGKRDWAVEGTQ